MKRSVASLDPGPAAGLSTITCQSLASKGHHLRREMHPATSALPAQPPTAADGWDGLSYGTETRSLTSC